MHEQKFEPGHAGPFSVLFIGGLVGGGMAAGLVLTAGIPIIGAGVGYGIVKGIKLFIDKAKLNKVVLDSVWELGGKPETT